MATRGPLRVTARTAPGMTMPDDSALSDEEMAIRHSALLRRFLSLNNLSAMDFERRYGVAARNIERYLRGERIDPRRRDIHAAIARALGIPLYAEEGDPGWLSNPPVVQLTPLDEALLRAASQHGLSRLTELEERSNPDGSTSPRRPRSRSQRGRPSR